MIYSSVSIFTLAEYFNSYFNLTNSLNLTFKLFSLAMLGQGLEFFFLSRRDSFKKIWNYKNIQADLISGLPLPEFLIAWLFSQKTFVSFTSAQILLSLLGLIFPHVLILGLLFIIHLTNCLRFRGTFNGGSDMMTFVVLFGLLISYSLDDQKVKQLGLIFIAINTLYSYFKSGFSKLKSSDWKQGTAIANFMKRSLYSDQRALAEKLEGYTWIARFLGWFIIVFELLASTLLIYPRLGVYYFIAALLFHFINFVVFGLNRFFWIWLAAWPATLFALNSI